MAPSLETSNSEAINLKQVEEDEDGILFGINMMSLVVYPMAVRTAIELGIFDIIAKAGEGAKVSSEDIVVQLGTTNPQAPLMLDRVLRLLASHSMLSSSLAEDQQGQVSPKRLYSLNYASKYFVTDADGISFGPSLHLLLDKVFLESWTELKGAILEGGIPFNRVHGMHAFEYPVVDPRFNDVFNRAMLSITTIVMKSVLKTYEGFKNINRLVDVGGGLGINLKLVTSKYPNIQGVNFDLPHVIDHAPTFPGVEHVGGDMFESVPNGDAIFMKESSFLGIIILRKHDSRWILHDWSDEECLKLLKNCHKAIPSDGKVIVVDLMLPVLPENTINAKSGSQADVLMLTQCPGGKERTQNEFMELALGSGFSGINFVCNVSSFWVMEFFK